MDLLGTVQLETEQAGVLDKVEVSDNVVVTLLSGALLCGPRRYDWGKASVEGDVGDRRLASEQRGAGAEVRVQR